MNHRMEINRQCTCKGCDDYRTQLAHRALTDLREIEEHIVAVMREAGLPNPSAKIRRIGMRAAVVNLHCSERVFYNDTSGRHDLATDTAVLGMERKMIEAAASYFRKKQMRAKR